MKFARHVCAEIFASIQNITNASTSNAFGKNHITRMPRHFRFFQSLVYQIWSITSNATVKCMEVGLFLVFKAF